MHTNAPEVVSVVHAAFPDYTGRKIQIDPFRGPMRLESYWSGGHRDYFAIIELSTLKAKDISSMCQAPFSRPGETTLSALPAGFALIRRTYSGNSQYVHVYVHLDSMTKMLPAPIELPWAERVVLAATAGLKSHARLEQAIYWTKIRPDEYATAQASLKTKGLLNAQGAINNAGRNAIGTERLHDIKECRAHTTLFQAQHTLPSNQ